MKINVQAEGKILSITLTLDDTTTWGGVCKKAVEEHLTKVYPDLLLQRLLQLSPTERLSHYLFRYGDGCATMFCVEWSSASVPGCVRLPLASGYVEANVVLKPREGSMLDSAETDPHVAVQNANGSLGSRPKDDVDVDLSISVVSSAQTPNTYSAASTSVINIREHSSFPGCVDTIKMLPENEVNSVLSDNGLLPIIDAAATANLTSDGTSNKSKSISPKKDKKKKDKKKKDKKKKKEEEEEEDTASKPDVDAKKQPAAKSEDGESTTAAMKSSTKKTSPKKSSAATVTRSPPPKKSGEAMIQLYLANKANEEKAYSASSKSGEKKNTPSKKKSGTTESSSRKKDKSSSKKDKKTKAVDGESAKQSAAVTKKKTSKSKESNAVADEDKASKKKRKAPSDGESSDTKKSPSKKKKAKASTDTHAKLEKEESKKEEVTAHVTKRPREYKGKYKGMPEAPAKGMPDGWKEMHIPHASKPGYSYTVWYSPDGRRFDTKKGALSYIGFFEQTKDELAAFELFQAEQRVKKTSKICKSEGCLKLAQKGGKCIQHGGVVKKCSSAGCTNNAKRRGLCKRHGAYRDDAVLTC